MSEGTEVPIEDRPYLKKHVFLAPGVARNQDLITSFSGATFVRLSTILIGNEKHLITRASTTSAISEQMEVIEHTKWFVADFCIVQLLITFK